MKNTCLNCGKSFESSRSDAQYCSTNCRSKANYQKKRSEQSFYKANENISPENKTKDTINVQLSGELTVESVMQMIKNEDGNLLNVIDRTEQLLKINNALELELNDLQVTIEDTKDTLRREGLKFHMSDEGIYNTYLNEEYIACKQMNSINALTNYISGAYIATVMGEEYRKAIYNYKIEVEKTVECLERKLELLSKNEMRIQGDLNVNRDMIKNFKDDKRFMQMRIVRYENLLMQKS